jgi:hypothetical protein
MTVASRSPNMYLKRWIKKRNKKSEALDMVQMEVR